MPLTSSQNPLLQKVRRAVENGKPMDDGAVAAEGPHLLAEALTGQWPLEHIFCSGEGRLRHGGLIDNALSQGIEITEVSERAFKAVSDTEQSQGILCLVRPRQFEWRDLLRAAGPLVILDGIQDPGNAGAIVRSVEAFGGAGILLTEGCVRISNGKFLRAAAGSLFRVPFLENLERVAIIQELRGARVALFSLVARGRHSLFKLPFKGGFALAVGSEGGGVSALLLDASQTLSIPTHRVESLNAAVACSIALFEAARQRASQPI